MIFQYWGATEGEIESSVIGDDLCSDATLVATRSITIAAPPEKVFPWIRQMGFGRAGWYSYDWLDNLGRKSATTIHDEWQTVESGDKIPARHFSSVLFPDPLEPMIPKVEPNGTSNETSFKAQNSSYLARRPRSTAAFRYWFFSW